MEFLPIDSLDLDEWYGLSGEGNRGALMGSESYTDNIIPTMTSPTAPSGVVSAGSEYAPVHVAWRAFDHANATYNDSWMSDTGAPDSLQYQFPAARVITQYAITSINNGALPYSPKTWAFRGSNDGESWTTLDAQTDITDWAATSNVRKVFPFANATAHAYYRIDITASNDAINMGVGEMEMMESPWGTS